MKKIQQVDHNFYFLEKQQNFNKITKVIILEKRTKYDLITINILLEVLTDRTKTLNRHEFKLKKSLNYGLNFSSSFKEIDNNILVDLEISYLDLSFVSKEEAKQMIKMINDIFLELYVQQSNLEIKIDDYNNYLKSIQDKPSQISKFLMNDMLYVDDTKYLNYKNTLKYLEQKEIIVNAMNILKELKNSENFYYYQEGTKASQEKIKKLLNPSKISKLKVSKNIKRNVSYFKEEKNQVKRENQVSVIITYQSKDITTKDEYILKLLNLIIGGNSASKLFMNIREKENICYSIYSQEKLDYGIDIIIEVDKKNVELAIKRIDEEVKDIQKGNIDLEFKTSQKKYISNLKSNMSTGYFQKSFLDTQIIRNNAINTPEKLLEKIEKIKKEDVVELSKKLKRIKILTKN